MRIDAKALLAVLALGACSTPPPPFAPLPDGSARVDGSITPMPRPRDGSMPVDDDGGVPTEEDASTLEGVIQIDGLVSDEEWSLATLDEVNETSTEGTPFDGAGITRLRALRSETALYLAIEGSLGELSLAAMVVYVDVDRGGEDGRLLTLTGVEGQVGHIESVASLGLQAAELRPEAVFGVGTMPQARTAISATLGWRNITPDVFTAISVGTESACSTAACETVITLDSLRVTGTTTIGDIAIAARLGDGINWSNQTVPFDDPSQPDTIDAVALLPAP